MSSRAHGRPARCRPLRLRRAAGALPGRSIVNNGYDLALAQKQLAEGKADLVAFGRPFIANPDLVERLKSGASLAQPNPATIYGAEGYTDYPAA